MRKTAPAFAIALVLGGCATTTVRTKTISAPPAHQTGTVRPARVPHQHMALRPVSTVTEPARTVRPASHPRPDPALCQNLNAQWMAGGPTASQAIQEYGSIGCDLSTAPRKNDWCKTLQASDGSNVQICDFRHHATGAYPPA